MSTQLLGVVTDNEPAGEGLLYFSRRFIFGGFMSFRRNFQMALCSFALGLVACQGETLPPGGTPPPGPGGPQGNTGTPGNPGMVLGISDVRPNVGFLMRPGQLVITGVGSNWSAAALPTVDLGEKVTVEKVQVESATSLRVDINVAADAPMGLHVLKVKNAQNELTYAAGFNVESPLKWNGRTGPLTVEQGSVVQLSPEIVNQAAVLPFDPKLPVTFFEPSSDIALGTLEIGAAANLLRPITIKTDVLATPGVRSLMVVQWTGKGNEKISFPLANALNVVPRAATVLQQNAVVTQPAGSGSKLFSFQFDGSSLLEGTIPMLMFDISSVPAPRPACVLLPSSGKFSEMLDDLTTQDAFVPTASNETFYVSCQNSTSDYSVKASQPIAFQLAPLAALWTTQDKAFDLTPLKQGGYRFALSGMKLSSAKDERWIKLESNSQNQGKTLIVKVESTNKQTPIEAISIPNQGESAVSGSGTHFYLRLRLPTVSTGKEYFLRFKASSQGSQIIPTELKLSGMVITEW